MALRLLVLSLLVLYIIGTVESSLPKPSKPNPTDFIRSSCKATRYPNTCVQSLSGYASAIGQNDHQLAITALSVSVSRTRLCASFVKKMGMVKGMKPKEYNIVRDCIENMNDSVDHLSQSVKELGLIGKAQGKDSVWRVNNVQTWVSAAITDQNTCLNGLDGPHIDGKLKATIRPKVVDASQVTSNALALVNRFASHK